MQKDTIILLANYNKSVNSIMNGLIKTLDQNEWEKPLGGFFPSVHSLCSHLYISDYNYLKRFSSLRPFNSLNDPFYEKSYSFKETIFSDMVEYLDKRPDLDNRIITFVSEITDGDLENNLKYTDSQGTIHERKFGKSLMQFFNHQTHHRGGISVYLDMLGRENDFSFLS